MTGVRTLSSTLLVAVLLLGCQPASEAPTPTPAPPPVNSASPAPTDSNPDRINQLKDLNKVEIPAPKGTMKLWIMDNPSKRQEGMMFLVDREVKDDEGMIFVFPEVQADDGKHGFWMHNTPMGLDIAYVSKDKKSQKS